MSIFVNNNSDALLLDSPVTANDVNINGLFTDQDGYIKAIRGGTPTNYSQGIPVDSTGRVCVQQNGIIATWQNGLPYDINNRLCITANEALSTTNGLPFAERLKATTPTLNLNFTNKVLDSRITFTRASSGTFVGSNGLIQSAALNVARFTHDPITLQCLGLLIESQRTNLALRSEEFNQAIWQKINTSASVNVTTSPDGTINANKLVENTANGFHYTIQAIANVPQTTISVFAKKAERSVLRIQTGGDAFGADFNLNNGTVGNVSSATASIIPYPNDWYRCIITTTNSVLFDAVLFLLNSGGFNTAAYVGDGSSGLFLWGAQVETGAFATSYIPTTAASVTRNTDIASITGGNFSSWFNSTEGTIYFQGNTATASNFFSIDDGTVGNRLTAYMLSTTTPYFYGASSGATIFDITSSTITANATFKQAGAYKANDFAISTNGGTVSTDTSGALPTVNRMIIGANVNGGAIVNGTIQRLVYYPIRLPNTELQRITQ